MWRVITFERKKDATSGMWLFDELLIGNSLFTSRLLSSASMRSKLRDGGCVKLCHLMETSVSRLSELFNIHSQRLVLGLVKWICASFFQDLSEHLLETVFGPTNGVIGMNTYFPL